MFATVLLTGNNKPRSKVKRDCGARILVCSSGNHCAHRHRITVPIVSLADRARARESALARKANGGRGEYPSGDGCQLRQDVLDRATRFAWRCEGLAYRVRKAFASLVRLV